jgi:SAM-dependent methyltransferase
MELANPSLDYSAVTARQQATWASGDFNEIGRQTVPAVEALCEAVDPHAGERVLDVACGNGSLALAAARRYCEVAAIDFVPAIVERARRRAEAEGATVDFRVADAQDLPFPDASFDVVVSTFGVIFAPDQEKAAGELLRVCRPGGRIGLCTWPPEGLPSDTFQVQMRYAPPPPSALKPPTRWGTPEGLAELLGAGTSDLRIERRSFRVYYRSAEHEFEVFRRHFGPMRQMLGGLDESARANVARDMAEVYQRYNRATDGTMIHEMEYLQVVGTRKA